MAQAIFNSGINNVCTAIESKVMTLFYGVSLIKHIIKNQFNKKTLFTKN